MRLPFGERIKFFDERFHSGLDNPHDREECQPLIFAEFRTANSKVNGQWSVSNGEYR
jgi:hypothetical protein